MTEGYIKREYHQPSIDDLDLVTMRNMAEATKAHYGGFGVTIAAWELLMLIDVAEGKINGDKTLESTPIWFDENNVEHQELIASMLYKLNYPQGNWKDLYSETRSYWRVEAKKAIKTSRISIILDEKEKS